MVDGHDKHRSGGRGGGRNGVQACEGKTRDAGIARGTYTVPEVRYWGLLFMVRIDTFRKVTSRSCEIGFFFAKSYLCKLGVTPQP